MKATLTRPDGSTVHVEGSVAEIAQLFLDGANVRLPKPRSAPQHTEAPGKRKVSEETRQKMSAAKALYWKQQKKKAPKKR